MIARQKEVTFAEQISVDLPKDSIPLEFINQGQVLYLWYADSEETKTQQFFFGIYGKNKSIAPYKESLGSVKWKGGGAYKQCFWLV